MTRLLLLSLAFALISTSLSCDSKTSSAQGRRIAVIPKGTTHEFWKAIHAGAQSAAQDIGVEVLWKGPIKEDDRSAQIAVVEDMITKGVDGIVLAPLDNEALVGVVKEATDEGIPVIIIDSGLESDQHVSFIATDNYEGGVQAAKAMGDKLGGKGRVIMLRYMEGSASTMKRESGFLNTMESDYPDIEVVSHNQYGGADDNSARQVAENLLGRHENLQGVFCPNESTTIGMLLALREAGLTGKLYFGGFDSSEALIKALSAGEIDSLIVQNPWAMGDRGIRTMIQHLDGQKIEGNIDTGCVVATKENMSEDKVKALLSPDLSILDQ